LGERAFEDCSMLSTVSLPSTLERMGTYASNGDEEYLASYDVFSGCKMLSSVTVDSANEKFTSIGGVLYTKKDGDAQILFYAPVNVSGEITIPATATEIKADVFADHRRVTAVKFAGALEGSLTIGENAFSGCTSLKTLELVEGVTTIGANAFNKCSALVSVNIPASVTLIERGAFNSCAALSSLTFDNGNEETLVIADSVSDYGYDSDAYGVFAKDAALTNVVFPTDRALSLGSYAFIDCANLESVTFGKDVVAFGSNVFKKCRKLKTLNDFDKISSLKSIPDNFLANTAITSIVVPEGVETMGVSVFEDCTNLVHASLPASLTHIGKQYSASSSSTGYYITYEARTFAGCYALENVTFANDSKLERINMSMFLDCVSLKSVELPDTIERIEQQAFYGSGIESITIPASVTKLDFFAFMNCKDLTTVNFATEGGISQLRTMEKRVFANSGLTSFTFPTTIVPISLNEGIFENCKDLETITLSKTVTNLGDSLYGNYSIKNIIVADENKNYLVDSDSESGKVIYNVSKTVLKTFVGVWNSDTFEIPEGVTEISSKAFEGQYRIKKIIVPASVNKIGTSAFKSCVGLEEIEFADYPELTESGIGNYIFQFCSNLKTVTLPSTFTTIPKYMFSYSNVETVKISEKVTAIADYAFAYAYNFKKLEGVTADTEIKVKTIGASAFRESLMTSFFVPDSVTSLGNYVFYKCANLTSVTGMKNVTTIGADAFEYTTSLKEFSLPAGVTTLSNYLFSHSGVENIKNTEKVTSVGKYVFQYCENLKTIDLSSVTTIGNYAFRESGISSIALPKLKTLGTYAFDACVALESVDLGASSLSKLDKYTFQNCTSLTDFVFPTTLTSLELYSLSATKIVIADLSNTKLTTINPQVFRDNKVLSVVILPETTNKVGAYAFQDCTSLKYINLAKVKTIDYNAFMNTALYSVDLASCTSLNSSGLQFSGCKELVEVKNFTGTSVPKQMFENCTSLRSIDLSNVVTINANAFNGCTALKKADLSVAAKIGDKAFYGSGLTEVTISDDLTSRGSNIFTGSDIKEFKLAKASKVYSVKDGALYIGDMLIYYPSAKVPNEGKENEGTLVLPESYADGAFEGAKGIRKLVVGKNVQTIVSGTFANCVNLTEVAFEEGSILVSIGDEAFMGCSALETVTLPKTLNVIGDYAFADTGLKSVVIPSSALVLGDGAFSGCSALASVTLPEGVVSLGNEAFQNTTSLKNIILPESLRNIGDYTFNGSGIESIVVPEGVTVIGNTLASRVGGFVFANCESLVSVTFKGDIVSIAPSTFVNSTSLSTVLFRGQTAAEDGSVVLPNTLVTLGNMAFNNTGITGVVIPESVIELGTQTFAENAKLKKAVINAGGLVSGSAAFLNCTALTEVKFGENVTSLGEALNSSNYTVYKNGHMFDGCTALSKVDLGSLEVIADYMFAGTTSLESITLPANAKIISVYAFSGSGLKSINLNEGLYRIDASAFVDCASLESIVIPSTVGDWYTFMYNGAHKTNILLNSFSTSTFKGCKSLKTVEFKCYMPTIGGSMFEGCTSLQSIKFTSTPADKTGLVIPSGIAIGPYAFAGIGSDKTLELLGDYNEACKGSYISTTRTWYDNCDAKIIIDGKVFKEADVA
ncbi:MAG TPA: hypothetical protein DDY77_05285, partial [Clostridiales bacterium]|nr:hypothetical protein [Clostridiales bacterium]